MRHFVLSRSAHPPSPSLFTHLVWPFDVLRHCRSLDSCLFCPSWPLAFFPFHRSSWELPELREGRVKAISDSDGVSYPWYGNTTETVTLSGPTQTVPANGEHERQLLPQRDLGGAHQQQHAHAHAHHPRPELHHLAGGTKRWHQRAYRSSDGALAYARRHWGGSFHAAWFSCQTDGTAASGTAAHSQQQRAHPAQRAGQAQCQRCPGADVEAQERTTSGSDTTQIGVS